MQHLLPVRRLRPLWKAKRVFLCVPVCVHRTLLLWSTPLSSLVSHCFLCLCFLFILPFVICFTKVWWCEMICVFLHHWHPQTVDTLSTCVSLLDTLCCFEINKHSRVCSVDVRWSYLMFVDFSQAEFAKMTEVRGEVLFWCSIPVNVAFRLPLQNRCCHSYIIVQLQCCYIQCLSRQERGNEQNHTDYNKARPY